METRNQTHPTARQLAALAFGKLANDSRARLQQHVDECMECSRFLADTPRDTLAGLLKDATGPTSIADQSTPGVRDATTFSGLPHGDRKAAAASPKATEASRSGPSATDGKLTGEDIPESLRAQSKYRIERLLGRGGMGSVFQAYHERMDRKVAIKIINPSLVDHPEALKRFDQEVKAAAKLDHPNVARAYDADEIGSLRVLVMEFVPGQSLEKFLARRGRLTVVEACRLVRQAMIGLDHAHSRGMVHRDLKPQNLMLTPDGKVKILDFGLAKVASERHGGAGLTRDNALMGTPHYLAPEQALNAAKADIRADIYSLGCTLYCLLASVPPFDREAEFEVLLAHQNDTPKPLSELCPDIPRALSDLVDRMLAKNPADRPQTPREAAEALLPFAKGESTSPAGQAADPFAFLQAEAERDARAPLPIPALATLRKAPNRFFLWSGGAAAAVLLLGFAAWAAGMFTVQTPEGTIIVEHMPADIDVQVDGSTVTLSRNGEQVIVEAMRQGDHHLKFTRNGKQVWTSDAKIEFGGQQVRVKYDGASETARNEGAKRDSPAPRAVDLLDRSLIDLDHDTVVGTWSWDGEGVACPAGGALLRLPYRPPLEYDFAVEFTVKSGADGRLNGVGLCQLCSFGERNFHWQMGNDNNTFCRFWIVDWRRTPPERRMQRVFDIGKRQRSVVSVRRGSVSARLNDEEICRFEGSPNDVSCDHFWLGGFNRLGVASDNSVEVHRIEVTEVSGPGRTIGRLDASAEKQRKAEFAALSMGAARTLTDFTPRVWQVGWSDLSQNANTANWPVSIDGKPCEHYLFATAPSSILYDIPPGAIGFRAIGTGTQHPDPAGEWRFVVHVDDKEAFLSDRVTRDSQPALVEVALPRGARRMELSVDCLGSGYRDHAVWAQPEFLFPDAESAEKAVPHRPDISIPSTARRVNLLAAVDPYKDKITGSWILSGSSLMEVGTVREPARVLECPYVPPTEYDVRMVFVPLKHIAGTGIIGCAAGRQFAGIAGGWGNDVCGFELIDNKRADFNDSTTRCPSRWLMIGRSHELLLRVREGELVLYLDGVAISRADPRRMTLRTEEYSLRRNDVLGLLTWNAVDIKSLDVFEVTGQGTLLRPADASPGQATHSDAQTNAPTPAETEPSAPKAWTQQRFPNAEITFGGDWKFDGDELVQSSQEATNTGICFGNPTWSRYNLSFKAMAEAGRTGFAVAWHASQDNRNFRVVRFGWQKNSRDELSRFVDGQPDDSTMISLPGTIDRGKWYDVRIEVRGTDCRCYLNDEYLRTFDRADPQFTTGRIGLGGFATAMRFKDIKVTDESNRTLWEGLPKLPGK